MKKKKFGLKEGLIWLGLLLVFIISFFFDKYVYYLKDSNIFLNYLFNIITNLGNFFVVLAVVGVLLYKSRLFKPFVLSLFVSGLIGIIVKFVVQRPRPFDVQFFPFGIADNSFPSFHAISAVVGLVFLDKIYPKLRIVWIILGGVVLFSRIYLGFHFFSDVIAGGIIAYVISKVFILKWN